MPATYACVGTDLTAGMHDQSCPVQPGSSSVIPSPGILPPR